jgi:MFS transporter, DHA1 family, multidrug resistance protein
MRAGGRLGRVVGSEITALCLVVFLADVVGGIISPTFSLYAKSLGLSLALIGLLSTVGGFTQLLTSLPFGILSDRIGRPRLLRTGMLAAATATLLFALADGPALLFIGRVILALSMVMTFQIGAAHLGDITPRGDRSFAFGCYATAMGLGFAAGPLLGGQLSERYGTDTAYFVASGVALTGFLLAWRRLHDRTSEIRRAGSAGARVLSGLGQVVRRRSILLVSGGNMLMGLAFIGGITTFFPLYGDSLFLTQATIGTMFAVRAFVSTLGRFPNGLISRRFGSQVVLLGALALEAMVMFGIATSQSSNALILFLALDGLAFGAYLVAGQTFLAENTEVEVRGAAVGLYSTASGVGGTFGSLALALVASRWGVATVFPVIGGCLAIGFVVCLAETVRQRKVALMPLDEALIDAPADSA